MTLPEIERKNGYLVLVVEDEPFIRLCLADDLRSAGYDVIEAANAPEALNILQNDTAVDVLITDVRMPGSIDGYALAKIVRAEFPNTKIVVATAHAQEPIDVVIDGFFAKPYDPVHVVSLLRSFGINRPERPPTPEIWPAQSFVDGAAPPSAIASPMAPLSLPSKRAALAPVRSCIGPRRAAAAAQPKLSEARKRELR